MKIVIDWLSFLVIILLGAWLLSVMLIFRPGTASYLLSDHSGVLFTGTSTIVGSLLKLLGFGLECAVYFGIGFTFVAVGGRGAPMAGKVVAVCLAVLSALLASVGIGVLISLGESLPIAYNVALVAGALVVAVIVLNGSGSARNLGAGDVR